MKLSRSIAGKTALVTGAASGIGRATALLFAQEGARVAAADLHAEPLEALAAEAAATGATLRPWTLDVRDDARVREVVAELVDTFGSLHLLANCAGVSVIGAFGDEEAWNFTLDVNLKGTMRVCRAALPHLVKSGEGRIVNIASTEGLGATPLASPYTASKHGVIGLTRGLAVEVASRGVTANAICPGPIRTGMTSAIPDADKEKFARRRVPLKRYGHPEEVAHAILSLCLPAASYITGTTLLVDGGLRALNARPL